MPTTRPLLIADVKIAAGLGLLASAGLLLLVAAIAISIGVSR
jgi:hypothetical protein